jgi:integrase
VAKHKLSVKGMAAIGKERRRYNDGGGLWLQVSDWGTKAWIFQYASPTQTMIRKRTFEMKDGTEEVREIEIGKPRQLGLGSCIETSLAEARRLAEEKRALVKAGIDPIEAKEDDRRTKRLAVAKLLTFKECAEKYIATHRSGWRNEKHIAQWSSTLATYAYPIIGDVSVAQIDTVLVKKVVEQIWSTKPETAKRLRGRIEQVLDYAKALRAREGENPAAWKGNLKHLLAKQDTIERPQPSLPYEQVGEFIANLRARQNAPKGGQSARALEFTILTAARTGAVTEARRREFDFNRKTWTVPATRAGTKLKKHDHVVPLSDRAIEILRSLPQAGEFMFAGGKEGEPLSNMAMAELVKQINAERKERRLTQFVDPRQDDKKIVVHGFRTTFDGWATDCSSFDPQTIDFALAHKISDKTIAAYRRSTAIDKRRKLMEAWAEFCERPAAPPSENVTPLRGRRAPVAKS